MLLPINYIRAALVTFICSELFMRAMDLLWYIQRPGAGTYVVPPVN